MQLNGLLDYYLEKSSSQNLKPSLALLRNIHMLNPMTKVPVWTPFLMTYHSYRSMGVVLWRMLTGTRRSEERLSKFSEHSKSYKFGIGIESKLIYNIDV
jgi:hypothetical protein